MISKFTPPLDRIELSPYIGKAGEHLVLAGLLLRKFDAALVEVDAGTDIFAEKNGKLARIQVKTRRIGDDKESSFVFGKKTIENKACPNYFAIVLLDMKRMSNELFIFPLKIIRNFIKKGLIRLQKKQNRYYARVIFRNDVWHLGNLKNEITKYRDAFDLIK